MMAPMGKGTRAAGTRRRADAPAPAPGPAQQPGRPDYGRGSGQGPQPPAAPPRSSGRPKSGRGATFSVVMMTLAALAAVGVLAAQAEATAPKVHATGTSAANAKSSGGSKPGSSSATALPANSGSGTRIVYSPSARRAWLVENSTVERTMTVVPGTVTPPAGSYTVYGKRPGSLGGDGVTVLYVVSFDSSAPNTFGFDAEAGVAGLPPAPKGHTGGIRMTQIDAQLLYEFASVGTTVVVV